MATVRGQIMEAIFAALAAISSPQVGLVVDLGQEEEPAIAGHLAAGTHVIELLASDDEVWAEHTGLGIEAFQFDVGCLVHLARIAAPPPAEGNLRPSVVAAEIHAAIYKTYSVDGVAGVAGTWGGLAIKTECLGGGNVAIDPQMKTQAGFSAFRVYYRHRFGAPEEAA